MEAAVGTDKIEEAARLSQAGGGPMCPSNKVEPGRRRPMCSDNKFEPGWWWPVCPSNEVEPGQRRPVCPK